MARYTGFILEFILGLRAAVRGVEAFVFSEELERVTELVDRPGAPGPAWRPAKGGLAPAGRFAASAR